MSKAEMGIWLVIKQCPFPCSRGSDSSFLGFLRPATVLQLGYIGSSVMWSPLLNSRIASVFTESQSFSGLAYAKWLYQ